MVFGVFDPPPEEDTLSIEIRPKHVTFEFRGRKCISSPDFPGSPKLKVAADESPEAYGEALFNAIIQEKVTDGAGLGNHTRSGYEQAIVETREQLRIELTIPTDETVSDYPVSLTPVRWEYLKESCSRHTALGQPSLAGLPPPRQHLAGR